MKKKQEPSDDGAIRRLTIESTHQMAARCRLNAEQYEQRVLLPAIRRAERQTKLPENVPELHRRAMRAAGTAGFRTTRGLRRWIENVTWRWRRQKQQEETRRARATRRELPAGPVPAGASDDVGRAGRSDAGAAAEDDRRTSMEREALDHAANEREAARLAGIEQRRMHMRRAVLGAEAAAQAENGRDATADWATERWRQLEKHSQEACWAILRPLLGLEPGTYKELIERKRQAESERRAGLRPRGDQDLLARRKRWRKTRVAAWTLIGERIRHNAAGEQNTAHEAITAAIQPRYPRP